MYMYEHQDMSNQLILPKIIRSEVYYQNEDKDCKGIIRRVPQYWPPVQSSRGCDTNVKRQMGREIRGTERRDNIIRQDIHLKTTLSLANFVVILSFRSKSARYCATSCQDTRKVGSVKLF